MKQIIVALGLIGLAVLPLAAQDSPSKLTNSYRNGRAWNSMDAGLKLGYLLGCADFRRGVQEQEVQVAVNNWPNLTYREISQALDRFYGVPENANIPILVGIEFVDLRVRGTPEDVVQKLVENARKNFPYADDVLWEREPLPPLTIPTQKKK